MTPFHFLNTRHAPPLRVFVHTIPLHGTLFQLDTQMAKLFHLCQISAHVSWSPVTSFLKFEPYLLTLLYFISLEDLKIHLLCLVTHITP